jgi:hypothetical protein
MVSVSLSCYGQSKSTSSYLLVRFIQQYDHSNKRDYFIISAEGGCDSAKKIYSLLYYNNNKNVINTSDVYSYNKKDTTGVPFNYFISSTDGINYMLRKGWTLHGIFTETFSGYINEKNGAGELFPITTVSSRPVFCFVKN